MDDLNECWTCLSSSGARRISPGPTIYEGRWWLVEHAYPTALRGWLVLVLKRHAEALHDLTHDELTELGLIQAHTVKLLEEMFHCEKEYVMCLAESEHFHHVHVHIIPKPANLPDEFKATKIFALIKPGPEQVLPPVEVADLCLELRDRFAASMCGESR